MACNGERKKVIFMRLMKVMLRASQVIVRFSSLIFYPPLVGYLALFERYEKKFHRGFNKVRLQKEH